MPPKRFYIAYISNEDERKNLEEHFLKKRKSEIDTRAVLGSTNTNGFLKDKGWKDITYTTKDDIIEIINKIKTPSYIHVTVPNSKIDINIKKYLLEKDNITIEYLSNESEEEKSILTSDNLKEIIKKEKKRKKARESKKYDLKPGFGWNYDTITKTKVENEVEYPILMEIKEKYENGEMCTEIFDYITKNYEHLGWTKCSRVMQIVDKNNFKWGCNRKEYINNDGFYQDDNSKRIYIMDLEKVIKEKESISSCSAFKNSFPKDFTIYCNGRKLDRRILDRYFETGEKVNIEKKIDDRILFLLNDKDNFNGNRSIAIKLKEEFKDLTQYTSAQFFWRRIKEVENKREKIFN